MNRGRPTFLVAALAVWLTAGCGGATSTSSATSSSTAAQQPQPAAASFDVTIAHGEVMPSNATWQAKVGQPITVRVTSDVPDELHVHSSPDHEFEVAAAPNQTFSFTVDVPGSVEIELHKLDRTVATLQVRP
jgi:plastocyanin